MTDKLNYNLFLYPDHSHNIVFYRCAHSRSTPDRAVS